MTETMTTVSATDIPVARVATLHDLVHGGDVRIGTPEQPSTGEQQRCLVDLQGQLNRLRALFGDAMVMNRDSMRCYDTFQEHAIDMIRRLQRILEREYETNEYHNPTHSPYVAEATATKARRIYAADQRLAELLFFLQNGIDEDDATDDAVVYQQILAMGHDIVMIMAETPDSEMLTRYRGVNEEASAILLLQMMRQHELIDGRNPFGQIEPETLERWMHEVQCTPPSTNDIPEELRRPNAQIALRGYETRTERSVLHAVRATLPEARFNVEAQSIQNLGDAAIIDGIDLRTYTFINTAGQEQRIAVGLQMAQPFRTPALGIEADTLASADLQFAAGFFKDATVAKLGAVRELGELYRPLFRRVREMLDSPIPTEPEAKTQHAIRISRAATVTLGWIGSQTAFQGLQWDVHNEATAANETFDLHRRGNAVRAEIDTLLPAENFKNNIQEVFRWHRALEAQFAHLRDTEWNAQNLPQALSDLQLLLEQTVWQQSDSNGLQEVYDALRKAA